MELLIHVKPESDGYQFYVDKALRQTIHSKSPVKTAARLFISYETAMNFEEIYSSDMLLSQIPILLTGLSAKGLFDLGFESIVYSNVISGQMIRNIQITG